MKCIIGRRLQGTEDFIIFLFYGKNVPWCKPFSCFCKHIILERRRSSRLLKLVCELDALISLRYPTTLGNKVIAAIVREINHIWQIFV